MIGATSAQQVGLPAATSEPLLCAKKVRKSYGGIEVLKGVSLTVDAGQVMCLLGPSGSGKSTFLRCINTWSGSTAVVFPSMANLSAMPREETGSSR